MRWASCRVNSTDRCAGWGCGFVHAFFAQASAEDCCEVVQDGALAGLTVLNMAAFRKLARPPHDLLQTYRMLCQKAFAACIAKI